MDERFFMELGEFVVCCWAVETSKENWVPYILFERKGDIKKTVATNKRNRVQSSFRREQAAIDHAIGFAHKLVEDGKTGL